MSGFPRKSGRKQKIGGGYLVWLWPREGRAVFLGVLGGLLLFMYGIVRTLQPAHFGRVYAVWWGLRGVVAGVGMVG